MPPEIAPLISLATLIDIACDKLAGVIGEREAREVLEQLRVRTPDDGRPRGVVEVIPPLNI